MAQSLKSQISKPDLGLYKNVLNEILNGFEVPDFEMHIGAPRSDVQMLFATIKAKYHSLDAGSADLALSEADAQILINAARECIRELGEEELSTRTGFTIDETEQRIRQLQDLIDNTAERKADVLN